MATLLTPVRTARADLRDVLACTAGGALAGLLVGGLGGRLAMLLLRLTSDDRLRGIATDDQFEIGVVSLGTLFLLGVGAGLGAVGGLLYGGLRGYLPPRPVVAAAAVGGLVGGSLVIHPGGTDFTLLDPLALAVALFVVLPAAGAAAVVVLGERYVAADWWGRRRARTAMALVPALTLVPFLPASVPAAAVAVLAVAGARRGLADRPGVRAVVLGALAVVSVVAGVALVRDVAEIL